MKYHLTEAGEPKRCVALKRPCIYGADAPHFATKAEAQRAFEEAMAPSQQRTHSSVKKSKTRKELLAQLEVAEAPLDLSSTQWDFLYPLETQGRQAGVKRTESREVAANPQRCVRCSECGMQVGDARTALNFKEYGYLETCQHCGVTVSNAPGEASVQIVVDPNPDSHTYGAVEAKNVPKMLWYHWTTQRDWANAIVGPKGPKHVHLGGERAAADRSGSGMSGPGKPVLYLVEVDPSAVIDEHLHDEEAEDFAVAGENQADVVRYVNMFEDSGSISLAIKPSALRVIGFRELANLPAQQIPGSKRPYDFENVGTYYLARE